MSPIARAATSMVIRSFRAGLRMAAALARPWRRSHAPTLAELARKHDDRLLRDIGVTRAEALGLEGFARRELERARRPWTL